MRLGFFLGEAFGSMRRNWVMAMAAVITVFISTAILGAVLVTRDNLNQGATSLKNRVMIEVFIKDDASDAEKAALQQKIQSIPEVKSSHFVSKEEALERFRKRFGERIVAEPADQPAPRELGDPGQGRQPGRRRRRPSSSTTPPSTTIPAPTTG